MANGIFKFLTVFIEYYYTFLKNSSFYHKAIKILKTKTEHIITSDVTTKPDTTEKMSKRFI